MSIRAGLVRLSCDANEDCADEDRPSPKTSA
jgi:hypothetical protein